MKTGRRCGGALAALMLLLFAGDGFGASVVEKDVDKDGKSEFVLDNKALRLVIAPHFGAQAISVFRNDIGVEYVPIEPGGGFFSDHDSRQTWPGEFFSAKYDVSIQKDSGEEAAVMCTRVATGEWQDKRLPSLEGLKVEREVALMGDRPLVRLRVRFANETEEGKFLHYWFQNIGSAGGSVPRDRIFRPGTEALDPEIGDVTQ